MTDMTDREKKIENCEMCGHVIRTCGKCGWSKVYEEDLSSLKREVERLQQENKRLKEDKRKLHNVYESQFEKAVHAQQERDKAVAELRRFAERDPYATSNSAKRVLSQLGVSHETT